MLLYIDGNYPLHSLHGELVSSLANLGNEITVFVPMRGKELDGKYDCDHPNAKIIYSDILNNLDRIFLVQKLYKIASEIEKAVDMRKVDCILAGTVYSDGGVAYLLHKKYGIPFSVTVRQTDVTYHMKWRKYLNSFVRKVLSEATKVIFISPVYQKFFRKFSCEKGKYVIIPNAVNDFWFANQTVDRTLHNPISLVFVGEISKNKNVSSIISTVSKLAKSGLAIKLDIVGSGSDEENCKQVAKELNVYDIISFNGWMDSKEKIKAFYDRADIFIMLSLRETFGTVYIEALSQGLPIVYTRGQGIDGYFEQGTVGYACNPKDEDETSEAIKAIVRNYKSISKRCVVESQAFQWKVVSNKYNEVISHMRGKCKQ